MINNSSFNKDYVYSLLNKCIPLANMDFEMSKKVHKWIVNNFEPSNIEDSETFHNMVRCSNIVMNFEYLFNHIDDIVLYDEDIDFLERYLL